MPFSIDQVGMQPAPSESRVLLGMTSATPLGEVNESAGTRQHSPMCGLSVARPSISTMTGFATEIVTSGGKRRGRMTIGTGILHRRSTSAPESR